MNGFYNFALFGIVVVLWVFLEFQTLAEEGKKSSYSETFAQTMLAALYKLRYLILKYEKGLLASKLLRIKGRWYKSGHSN